MLGTEDIVVGGGQSFFILPGNGDGTFQAPVLFSGGSDAGVQTLTSDFNGDGAPDLALYGPGSMGTTVFFNQGGVQVTITSSSNNLPHGSAVTFKTTVSPSFKGNATPTGSVGIKDGTTTIAVVTLTSGQSTFTTSALSTGTHSISATYYGNTSFSSGKSKALSQHVAP